MAAAAAAAESCGMEGRVKAKGGEKTTTRGVKGRRRRG